MEGVIYWDRLKKAGRKRKSELIKTRRKVNFEIRKAYHEKIKAFAIHSKSAEEAVKSGEGVKAVRHERRKHQHRKFNQLYWKSFRQKAKDEKARAKALRKAMNEKARRDYIWQKVDEK